MSMLLILKTGTASTAKIVEDKQDAYAKFIDYVKNSHKELKDYQARIMYMSGDLSMKENHLLGLDNWDKLERLEK